VTYWHTAHADLHWNNLTAPDRVLLDRESWGQAPFGYGIATLYCHSLLVPGVAGGGARAPHSDVAFLRRSSRQSVRLMGRPGWSLGERFRGFLGIVHPLHKNQKPSKELPFTDARRRFRGFLEITIGHSKNQKAASERKRQRLPFFYLRRCCRAWGTRTHGTPAQRPARRLHFKPPLPSRPRCFALRHGGPVQRGPACGPAGPGRF
jgi:hypothetical protein